MGTLWRSSGQVCLNNSAIRSVGARAFFYAGGTTTPLTVYEDADESTPHDHPLVADGNGRWPAVFIPFCASYDEKATTSGGTQLWYYEEIPNPDPVEAAADTVDDSELLQTGEVTWRPVGGVVSGRVRCNGRTIGNAASGATERANADTSDLFTYLWNGLADGQAAVSGGRGASAAADYAANKTIALPDLRFATIKGVADMGNTAVTVNAAVVAVHGDSLTAGSSVGAQIHALTSAQNGAHTHGAGTYAADSGGAHTHTVSGTAASDGAHTHSVTDPGHTHVIDTGGANYLISGSSTGPQAGSGGSGGASAPTAQSATTGISIVSGGAHTHTVSGSAASGGAHTHTVSGTSASSGSGDAHNNEPPAIVGTFYIKL